MKTLDFSEAVHDALEIAAPAISAAVVVALLVGIVLMALPAFIGGRH